MYNFFEIVTKILHVYKFVQAVRPLMAFCVFGELMKLILATMTSGVFAFFFSFVLAFEVLYFFLQCYISYTFLTMFFDVMF
ncbi:hypothetical protein PFNF54_01833 [Plasmodium falciparum NF54]|uniref:Uncharacterized protein n=1 Tax=Plasmodium falciparum (isolate NF54) TaxID=5843 RepID=W7K8M9_PLAFO|nr:hypothetical protein PFNF54_01833 [Plasmodium falciparum NF54]